VDATEIKVTTLLVTGAADLNGDVYVDGSINVRGSVIGSGPYIDTSDSRFKTNITKIENALDIVNKMNGVPYFPFPSLPTSFLPIPSLSTFPPLTLFCSVSSLCHSPLSLSLTLAFIPLSLSGDL
jgi:hypothetical protein